MIKSINVPHLGGFVKFGRKRPIAIGPHVKFSRYARVALPAPPTSVDYSKAAAPVIADIYGNDTLGDCVIAGAYHILGVETGNAGDLFHATQTQIIADYSAIGGYVPGDESTDQGCDETTAQNYWLKHGFADATKLLGWLAVDATNKTEIMQAIDLFENVFFGIELPDAWVNPFPAANGFVWDVAGDADPENGHCIVGIGYTPKGVIISTWGMLGVITWAAIAQYCTTNAGGSLSTWITPDQINRSQTKAPNGFAWTDLIADFDAMGGHVPVPAPAPVPPPAPAPVPAPPAPAAGVTLAQAQAWAIAGIAAGGTVQTRAGAERLASAALAAHWPKG